MFRSDRSQLGLDTGLSMTEVEEAVIDCVDEAEARVAVAFPLSQGTVTVTVVAALRGTTAPAAAVARAQSKIAEAFISKNESEE